MSWEEIWYAPRPSWWIRVARWALLPFSAVFAAASALNRWSWTLGWRKAERVSGLRVISVGNLVVGGAGKTPVVIFLARWALAAGERVAILSRGYGRRTRDVRSFWGADAPPVDEVGDEPLLIARSVPGVRVWVGPDRVALARAALAEGTTLALLDDGFQHRRLARDVDLVVVGDLENTHHLPAGPLREPPSALARAQVVWSRSARPVAHPLVVTARHLPGALLDPGGQRHPITALAGREVVAVCGIARPGPFLQGLREAGMVVARPFVYPDHHAFTDLDLELLRAASAEHGRVVVTTQKDLQRLEGRLAAWAVVLDVAVDSGLESLARVLGWPRELVGPPPR